MSVTPTSTILKLGESGFYISGALNTEELSNLKREGGINSFLYLCPDTATDSGLVSGFSSCDVFPPENSTHAPFDPTDFAFTVSNHTAPIHILCTSYTRLLSYLLADFLRSLMVIYLSSSLLSSPLLRTNTFCPALSRLPPPAFK